MKLSLAACMTAILAVPAFGQLRDNREPQLSCNDLGRSNRASACDLQERTLGPSGTVEVQPGRNGGVSVKGWAQNMVLVRARIEAWAENQAEARLILSQVRVDTGAGLIRTTGPDTNNNWTDGRNRSWSVSLEVFVPWDTNLKLESHNGGISVSDVRGRLQAESHNGGLQLTRVAADIEGKTHNGTIQVELDSGAGSGRQMNLATHNGSVTVLVPAAFSATVEARSNRGRVESDFPLVISGALDRRNVSFNLGAGGPLFRLSTHNGSIRLRRM